eukprot:scaffold99665_cov22-Tisochrysis_lutea.AAC.1
MAGHAYSVWGSYIPAAHAPGCSVMQTHADLWVHLCTARPNRAEPCGSPSDEGRGVPAWKRDSQLKLEDQERLHQGGNPSEQE